MSPALDPVRQSLDHLSRAWWRVRWTRVVARTVAVVAGVLVAWAVVDRLGPLGRWPLLLSGAGVALVVAGAVWWLQRCVHAHPPIDRMARLVEEQCPELDATLRSALDPAVEHSPFGPIVQADAAEALARLDEARIVDPDDRRRALLWAGGAVAAVLVAAGLAAPTAVRAARTARFVVAPPTLTLRVTPGDRRVVKGTALSISATIEGAPADLDVTAPQLIVEGEGARAVGALTRTASGAYQVRIPAVDRSFAYRVHAGGLRSAAYRIDALDRPSIEGIDLSYVYPTFSGLTPRTETDTGDIYAPAGTTVTVKVRASKALAAAQLRATDGEGARALQMKVVGEKQGEVAFTVARDGAYRIALTDTDAIGNGEETEYFVRVMDDRPPDVRIIRPSGDRGATRLEEVTLEARAEDDYGVQALELVYAVRGGAEKVVPLGGNGQSTTVSGKHTVYLEDLDVKPGDFVSYYARARDIGRGKRSTEARSDIFFLEIKPTAQEFTAAQSSAMAGGGAGGEMDDLVAAQKDVVSATWKLERRSAGGRSTSDIRAVARAQAEVRDKLAQQAAGGGAPPPQPRRRRGIEQAEPDAPPVPLQAAGEAMSRAVTQLEKLDTRSAITHEMEALNQLLKAEAEIRRRQLARQQQGQGGGRGRSGNEDLSALFDQELMRQQTNYQQQNSVESRQEATKGESALDKIRELARRQDDLAREQQQWARERSQMSAEEAKRRLDRLTREQQRLQQEAQQLAQQMQNGQQQGRQSQGQQGEPPQSAQGEQQGQPSGQSQQGQQGQGQGQGGQTQGGATAASRDRLREAAQQMGEATSQLQQQSPDQAAQRGSRSAQALRDAERALQAGTPGERQRAAGDVQLEARELAEAQRQLAAQAGALGQPQSGAAANERRRQLAGEQGRIADRVTSLERQVRELARGADPAKDALGQAARELQRGKTAEQLQQAARQLREGGMPQGTDIARQQRDAARVLDRVSTLASQASGRGTGETQALSDRLSDTRDLRDRLTSLEDRIAALSQQVEREARAAGGQDGQPGKASGQGGTQGSSSSTPRGQGGDQRAAQSGSQGAAQGQGNGEGRRDSREELRQLQQEYAREVQDASRMVQGSNAGGADRGGRMATPESHEFSRSAPGTEAFKQDFARWESLRKGVATAMDRYEAGLAQRLAAREAADRVQAPLRDKVPDRYTEAVVRYYQFLSRRPESR